MSILIPILISSTPALIALTYISRRSLKLWLTALVGGGGWLIALLLRQPLLLLLMGLGNLYPYIASFLAGLFEEGFRLTLLRIKFIRELSRKGAVSLGLGWGFSEALNIYAIPVYFTSIMVGYNWVDLLPGAIERNSAVLLHVSLSILLSVNPNDIRLLIASILTHTLVNIVGILSLMMLRDVWLVEAIIALTVLSVYLSIMLTVAKSKHK
ncbi:MAG: hypothetical protein RMH77_03025 [Sulfolobales archaeon]|nr:hypothetical protein [Sulfolobales archaeon]MCX8186068.1 hypothetical protein [Sulfolobales archaeon]MDW7969363.1 hypothetical protein [Sulfolobales archaeon]